MKRATKILSILTITLGAGAFLGLGIANFVDYHHVKQVHTLADRVSPQQWEAIATYCRNVVGFHNPEREEALIPEVFRPVAPLHINCNNGYSDLLLYKRGQAYAYVRVNSSPNAQHIFVFHNLEGTQKSIDLWSSTTPEQNKLDPADRLLTVREWAMHDSLEFIVQSNTLLFIQRGHSSGEDDQLLEKVTLSPEESSQMKGLINEAKAKVSGKSFVDEDVYDGFQLTFSYVPDGKQGDGDTFLSNAWTTDLDQLMAFIKAKLSPQFKIPDGSIMMPAEFPHHITVKTTREARTVPKPGLPWWILWR